MSSANARGVTRPALVLAGLSLAAAFLWSAPVSAGRPASVDDLHLVPRPAHVALRAGCRAVAPGAVLATVRARDVDGSDLVRERWRALGIDARGVAPFRARRSGRDAPHAPQAYRLRVDSSGVTVEAADGDGAFYALATLAQLAYRDGATWRLPCVAIDDAPALRWRILSDDVSRGPLPTMRYFKERIRTIAAFKMNGYSPYMEHVFVDPKHPLPAPLDGITPGELATLAAYAKRFHVSLVPEQQTFAHMHETLRWERYAALAELPHGYLLAPANPAGAAYARDLIADELTAVPHPPFFHIGSDEPSDLGRGASQALVARDGEGPVYVKHVVDAATFVAAHGARPMLWDDALARHPELFGALPKALVFVNWHYGDEPTYRPYIERIAKGGFEQMVAPGALNWNEIYPNLDAASRAIARFTTEGKDARVLGLFQTVWHDDGETLFEATWYPVLYAAAGAWEAGTVDRARFTRDLAAAFFGSDDPAFARDFDGLAACRTAFGALPAEYSDYLFWTDPLNVTLPESPNAGPVVALRLDAENVLAHLRLAPAPPLHGNAAAVMFLAALRYDLLGRRLQIAREARDYYDDARANADGAHDNLVYRGLFVAKYLFWEERDRLLQLEPLVRRAWAYENRSSHEESVLERYRVAADRAIARGDALRDVAERYRTEKVLPAFDTALGLAGAAFPSPAPSPKAPAPR